MSDLFSLELDRMHRIPDHTTSVEAARSVLPCRKVLQMQIYHILKRRGPMTDGELEKLPQFAVYGPSTVRKRRSELFQEGKLYDTGQRRDKMKVWGVVL